MFSGTSTSAEGLANSFLRRTSQFYQGLRGQNSVSTVVTRKQPGYSGGSMDFRRFSDEVETR